MSSNCSQNRNLTNASDVFGVIFVAIKSEPDGATIRAAYPRHESWRWTHTRHTPRHSPVTLPRDTPPRYSVKATKNVGRSDAERKAKLRELAQATNEVKEGALTIYPWLARFFPGAILSNSDRLIKLARTVGAVGPALTQGSTFVDRLALPAPPQGSNPAVDSRKRRHRTGKNSKKRKRPATASPSTPSSSSGSSSGSSSRTKRTLVAGESDLPTPVPKTS